MDIGLILVTETITNCQVRPHPPVILRVQARVDLRDCSLGITSGDDELGGATTQRANLCWRQPLVLEHQGAAIALEAADGNWWRARYQVIIRVQRRHQPAKEGVRAAKVSLVAAVSVHAAQATTKFERMLSLLPRSEVLQLPALVHIDTVANLRTATDK